MDDGGVVASVRVLQQVWGILLERGPSIGLHLNPSKCEWSWLRSSCGDPCPIHGVTLVPTDEICMLGVGSAAWSAAPGCSSLTSTLENLKSFEDSQSAFFLLRVSYSIVRAVHFMPTTPGC